MFDLTQRISYLLFSYLPAREITPPEYAQMAYPKGFPMMRFEVHQYEVEGFGHFMTMDTAMMGKLMRLSTLVFTPSRGSNVPFLLIDTMQMGKKNLAYAEYYDCTAKGAALPKCDGQKEEFASIPDYQETPAWYIARRTPYSLIKGGKGVEKKQLDEMVLTCVRRYLSAAAGAETSLENLAGLAAFREDMCSLGNPSTKTMSKVLGPRGAEDFFRNVVMPL